MVCVYYLRSAAQTEFYLPYDIQRLLLIVLLLFLFACFYSNFYLYFNLVQMRSVITACAVATSCCISDEPCQWEKANFNPPPTAPTFIDRSSWNSNFSNTSGRPPHMPNFVKIGLRGWAVRTPSLPQFWIYPLFVCFFLFVDSSHRVLAIPLDRLRCTMGHRTCFPPR